MILCQPDLNLLQQPINVLYKAVAASLQHFSKILLMCVMALSSTLFAQEGAAYIGTREVLEHHYDVSQKYGRNVLSLEQITTGYYDNAGSIVEKVIQKGNRTFMGRTVHNKSSNPVALETLEYNYMNLLSARKVDIQGSQAGEKTQIAYDAKGKILSKSSTRLQRSKAALWTLEYNQVGYAHRYYQSLIDSSLMVQEQRVFDYNDELSEIHHYLYDTDQRLIGIVAQSPSDSTIFRREYHYDYLGNLIESKYYTGEDQLIQSQRYSYDDHQRLIQSSEYVWNPRFGVIPELRKMREYSYR